MEKIELPVDKNESRPSKPDLKWWTIMLSILWWFIIISYLTFLWFSKIILANIDLETEKKWFWWINTEWYKKINYKNYIDYNLKEFKKYNFYSKNDEVVNAYAFLWWNIAITTWLLSEIETQEELIFILTHEIWHVENRDNLKKITTDIPWQLTMTFLGFDLWNKDFNVSKISWNILSKNTELEADKYAINFLKKYKLNPLCAKRFFEAEHNFSDSVMEMISDHPLNLTRINLLEENAKLMWFKDKKNCKKIKKSD